MTTPNCHKKWLKLLEESLSDVLSKADLNINLWKMQQSFVARFFPITTQMNHTKENRLGITLEWSTQRLGVKRIRVCRVRETLMLGCEVHDRSPCFLNPWHGLNFKPIILGVAELNFTSPRPGQQFMSIGFSST